MMWRSTFHHCRLGLCCLLVLVTTAIGKRHGRKDGKPSNLIHCMSGNFCVSYSLFEMWVLRSIMIVDLQVIYLTIQDSMSARLMLSFLATAV